MSSIETRYFNRGDIAARHDIAACHACHVEDIDEGMVLQHLGLDDGGREARSIIRDAADRAERGGYPDDGQAALEAARSSALRGYREAMRAA